MVDAPDDAKPKKPLASKPRKKRKKARRKSRALKAAAKPGRPEFEATAEQREKVEILIGGGMVIEEIAAAMELSEKTLRKHFRRELLVGRSRKRAEVLAAMFKAGVGGNVSAQKAYITLNALAAADDDVQNPSAEKAAQPTAAVKSAYVGKKEVAQEAAMTAGAGTEWGADLDPNAPPAGTKAH